MTDSTKPKNALDQHSPMADALLRSGLVSVTDTNTVQVDQRIKRATPRSTDRWQSRRKTQTA